MIISDTLHYRADGTVSSVTRVTRESYTSPSGRSVSEDVTTTHDLQDVVALLDRVYANLDSHNKSLEAQIATERESAARDKDNAVREAEVRIAALEAAQ